MCITIKCDSDNYTHNRYRLATPHDTTTRYDSRSTCSKAIWGKKD